jgi:hypothetical protein
LVPALCGLFSFIDGVPSLNENVNRLAVVYVLLAVLAPSISTAQTATAADERYFDFWAGTWHRVENGIRDPQPGFIVTKGVNDSRSRSVGVFAATRAKRSSRAPCARGIP